MFSPNIISERVAGMRDAAEMVHAQGQWMQDHNLTGNGFDMIQQSKAIHAACITAMIEEIKE